MSVIHAGTDPGLQASPFVTPHLTCERGVDRLIKEGRFQNASELLRAGLRLVEQQEREYEAKVSALREAAQKGWDDLDAGRFDDVADENLDDFISNRGSRSQGNSASG